MEAGGPGGRNMEGEAHLSSKWNHSPWLLRRGESHTEMRCYSPSMCVYMCVWVFLSCMLQIPPPLLWAPQTQGWALAAGMHRSIVHYGESVRRNAASVCPSTFTNGQRSRILVDGVGAVMSEMGKKVGTCFQSVTLTLTFSHNSLIFYGQSK